MYALLNMWDFGEIASVYFGDMKQKVDISVE